MRLKKLETLARELGYTIERDGRKIKWYRNNDKTKYGVSEGVKDASEDIKLDYQDQIKTPRLNHGLCATAR